MKDWKLGNGEWRGEWISGKEKATTCDNFVVDDWLDEAGLKPL